MAHFEVGHVAVHETLNLKFETDEDYYSLGCDESPTAGAGGRVGGAQDLEEVYVGGASESDGGEGDAGDSDDDYEEGSALMCKTLTESTHRAAEVPDDWSDAGDSSAASSCAESGGELAAAAAEAVQVAECGGDAGRLAQALYWQTEALMQRGDYEGASASAERAAGLFRGLGSHHGEARTLLARSALSSIAGRPKEALAQADMALTVARLCGDEALAAEAQWTHGACLDAYGGPGATRDFEA